MTSLLENVTIDAPDAALDQSNPSTPNIRVKDLNGPGSQEKAYDPSMLFLLELATSLAIRDEESMKDLSAEVTGYCTEILRQRKHLHPILVERTLIYLMALKKRGHETVNTHEESSLIVGCGYRNQSHRSRSIRLIYRIVTLPEPGSTISSIITWSR
jgi:hypothetical protein